MAWVRNMFGAKEPLIIRALFGVAGVVAVKRGELLEFTGNTNTEFVPMDSDFAGNSNMAVANEEIKSGDRAGYYEIIVPRPGDIFEFELAAAAAPVLGASLYWSTSQKLATSGSNALGYVAGQAHYPAKQGHLADDASPDSGTTVRTVSFVEMTFKEAVSYLKVVQKA
jgi:hypothetical protein